MKIQEVIKQAHLKPGDILIILFLVISSFLPLLIFSWQQSQTSDLEAVLRVDGQEIRRFSLAENYQESYEYYTADGDYNLIEVQDGKIRIAEADCRDQVCVRRGWASKNGETIVCLPHKLVLEVRGMKGSEPDSIIY